MKKVWNKHEDAELERLCKLGMLFKEIGHEMGLSEKVVQGRVRARGFDRTNPLLKPVERCERLV